MKTSLIKRVVIIIVILFGIISCDLLENKILHIPKAIIQKRAEQKFPIIKNFLIARLTMKNPKINFESEKIFIETDYDIIVLDGKSKGKIYLSSGIRYDKEKEELYLTNLSVDKILDEKGNQRADSKAENILKSIITGYVEMSPVYRYKEEIMEKEKNGKKNKVRIKNMYIKNGKFYVET
ncbi:DUF1439 domain-containing protein [Leptotrichia sp. OH3620_COT-345]|uniref:DUF1439 domain-containing protein n=1 Tax=Leptotrichia sp. OH3620_COT-345 TaxID=2491048 RepID=UPI000F64E47B|nr:DUF1439 domain-containing protein [Leptotrichia sp. OH3620_COT-345]RRD38842.1 DUF1439 domain-containing protein [Leptotrichia sp. OH3620_COT-345]